MPKVQKWIISDNSPYLDNLNKRLHRGQNYLDEINRPIQRRNEIRIRLPIVIKNSNTTLGNNAFFQHKNRKTSSLDGNFHLEEKRNTTFQSVGGYKTVKKELIQIIDMLKNKTKYEEYGVRLPKGILLEGPTGNGKTLLARAFAGEIEFPLIATSGAEFNEKYVGIGAARIRELFKFAQENQPCIIFIDEIDALARKRTSTEDGSSDERSQTLNQLLVALDGFNNENHVIIIGATNRIDILDPAVKRPGRMDKIIHIPNPDAHTRKEIIDIHRVRKPINATTEDIVKLTVGLNGAQIENMLNEATLSGVRDSKLPIDTKTLEDIRNRMILGNSIGVKNITEKTLKRVAIHEIGHLLMALNSSHFERPSKVTIDTSVFSSIGYTIFEKNDFDEGFFLREYCLDHLKILLGGRVAEETIYGNSVSSGAFSDLETAFNVARKMIMEYGMGTYIIFPHFSETYKKKIDQEIHSLIVNAYFETKKYLSAHKTLLIKLSDKLLIQKTLYSDDFVE
jgi:cell division protease FtsH